MNKFLLVTAGTLTCLAYVSWVVLSHHYTSDQWIYFTMGRGMLNGLKMWKDMFETKPPIVFWLSSLSLLAGDDTLYRILAVGGVLGMVGTLSRFSKQKLLAVIFGSSLGVYILIQGLGVQAEVFAALPIVLGLTNRRWWVQGLCLGFLILLKEPFALTFLMGLVLIGEWRKLHKVIALGIGAALLVLLVTGNLESYLTLYLPEMIFGRPATYLPSTYADGTVHLVHSSTFLRGLFFWKFFNLQFFGLFTSLIIFAWYDRRWILLPALYIITYAAGIGGFFQQHFLFALPVWIALFLQFEKTNRERINMVIAALLLLNCFFIQTAPLQTGVDQKSLEQAKLIDQILDSCHWDRYMIYDAENAGLQTFTKHSPFQLPYGMERAFDSNNRKRSPTFFKILEDDFSKTHLFISKQAPDVFTKDYPECAKPYKTNEMILYFRK